MVMTTSTTAEPAFGEWEELDNADVDSGAWWFPEEKRGEVRQAYFRYLDMGASSRSQAGPRPVSPPPDPADPSEALDIDFVARIKQVREVSETSRLVVETAGASPVTPEPPTPTQPPKQAPAASNAQSTAWSERMGIRPHRRDRFSQTAAGHRLRRVRRWAAQDGTSIADADRAHPAMPQRGRNHRGRGVTP